MNRILSLLAVVFVLQTAPLHADVPEKAGRQLQFDTAAFKIARAASLLCLPFLVPTRIFGPLPPRLEAFRRPAELVMMGTFFYNLWRNWDFISELPRLIRDNQLS